MKEDENTDIIHIVPNWTSNTVLCNKFQKDCANIISMFLFKQKHFNNPNICLNCKRNMR